MLLTPNLRHQAVQDPLRCGLVGRDSTSPQLSPGQRVNSRVHAPATSSPAWGCSLAGGPVRTRQNPWSEWSRSRGLEPRTFRLQELKQGPVRLVAAGQADRALVCAGRGACAERVSGTTSGTNIARGGLRQPAGHGLHRLRLGWAFSTSLAVLDDGATRSHRNCAWCRPSSTRLAAQLTLPGRAWSAEHAILEADARRCN